MFYETNSNSEIFSIVLKVAGPRSLYMHGTGSTHWYITKNSCWYNETGCTVRSDNHKLCYVILFPPLTVG